MPHQMLILGCHKLRPSFSGVPSKLAAGCRLHARPRYICSKCAKHRPSKDVIKMWIQLLVVLVQVSKQAICASADMELPVS